MDQRVELFQVIVDALLSSPGETSLELRQKLVQLPAQTVSLNDLPAELKTYVAKVATHAYKVTDEDVATLQQYGYSEDAIWEITLAISIGAGNYSLQQALKGLGGAKDASKNP